MFGFLEKVGSTIVSGVKSVCNKTTALFAVGTAAILASPAARAAGELITETDGVVTVNADALVAPVRTGLSSAVIAASTIFVAVFVVSMVVYFIKRFSRG